MSKARRSTAPRATEVKAGSRAGEPVRRPPGGPRRGRPRPPESPVLLPLRSATATTVGRAVRDRVLDEAIELALVAPAIDEVEVEGDDDAIEGFDPVIDPAMDAAVDVAGPADDDERDPDEAGASEPAPAGFFEPEGAPVDAFEDEPEGDV